MILGGDFSGRSLATRGGDQEKKIQKKRLRGVVCGIARKKKCRSVRVRLQNTIQITT